MGILHKIKIFLIKTKTLALFFLMLFTFIVSALIFKRPNSMPVFGIPITNKVVVIDPGHGGFDPGAMANGLSEKDINLKIAQQLQLFVQEGGGIAVLTRNDNESTTHSKKGGIVNKRSDMFKRKEIANEVKGDIFVSIHMNAGSRVARGAEVFYGSGKEKAKKLADSIKKSLSNSIKTNKKAAKKLDRDIYLFRGTALPTVIVECGFITNAGEASLLRQNTYQKKVARAIYLGIINYFYEEAISKNL